MIARLYRRLFPKPTPPPKCTDENIAALFGRIISHENNTPDLAAMFRKAEGQNET